MSNDGYSESLLKKSNPSVSQQPYYFSLGQDKHLGESNRIQSTTSGIPSLPQSRHLLPKLEKEILPVGHCIR